MSSLVTLGCIVNTVVCVCVIALCVYCKQRRWACVALEEQTNDPHWIKWSSRKWNSSDGILFMQHPGICVFIIFKQAITSLHLLIHPWNCEENNEPHSSSRCYTCCAIRGHCRFKAPRGRVWTSRSGAPRPCASTYEWRTLFPRYVTLWKCRTLQRRSELRRRSGGRQVRGGWGEGECRGRCVPVAAGSTRRRRKRLRTVLFPARSPGSSWTLMSALYVHVAFKLSSCEWSSAWPAEESTDTARAGSVYSLTAGSRRRKASTCPWLAEACSTCAAGTSKCRPACTPSRRGRANWPPSDGQVRPGTGTHTHTSNTHAIGVFIIIILLKCELSVISGPTQQLDNKINDFKHKQTSWSVPE